MWSKSGSNGLHQLQVRHWSGACGAQHDRDINATMNTLMLGQGLASKDQVTGYLKSCKSVKFQKKAYDVPNMRRCNEDRYAIHTTTETRCT